MYIYNCFVYEFYIKFHALVLPDFNSTLHTDEMCNFTTNKINSIYDSD